MSIFVYFFCTITCYIYICQVRYSYVIQRQSHSAFFVPDISTPNFGSFNIRIGRMRRGEYNTI